MSLIMYVFQGEYNNKSEELLSKATYAYVKDMCAKSLDFECIDFADFELKRTQSGKPFLEGHPFHFSISHTGEVWSCLMSPLNVGLDIQQIRKVNFDKLANRFFLGEEIEFVRDYGSDGFFDIWVRKEACLKYFGTGIRDIKTFSVVKNGKLAEEIEHKGNNCFMGAFELASDVKGAYCCGTRGISLWIKELN